MSPPLIVSSQRDAGRVRQTVSCIPRRSGRNGAAVPTVSWKGHPKAYVIDVTFAHRYIRPDHLSFNLRADSRFSGMEAGPSSTAWHQRLGMVRAVARLQSATLAYVHYAGRRHVHEANGVRSCPA